MLWSQFEMRNAKCEIDHPLFTSLLVSGIFPLHMTSPTLLRRAQTAIIAGVLGCAAPIATLASSGETEGGHSADYAKALAFLGIIVVLAKIAGAVTERFKQVSVLGELLLGILLDPVHFDRFVHPRFTNEIEGIMQGCQDTRVSSEI
jgi:hypothetical protein